MAKEAPFPLLQEVVTVAVRICVDVEQVWRWLLSIPRNCTHQDAVVSPCLQVEAHPRVMPALGPHTYQSASFEGSEVSNLLPASKEKDKNHLDFML